VAIILMGTNKDYLIVGVSAKYAHGELIEIMDELKRNEIIYKIDND